MSRQTHDRCLLLDLGGVVFDIDFHRVFRYWAMRSGTASQTLAERWQMDDAYRAHEVGELSFESYAESLAARLRIELSLDEWQDGWNILFKAPFPGVTSRLEQIATAFKRDEHISLSLCAFSNTNATHCLFMERHFSDTLALFQTVYFSNVLGRRKPDVSAYQAVCNQMGLPPKSVLFIDDSRLNISGAEAAGLQTQHAHGDQEVCAALEDALSELGVALKPNTNNR